MSRKRGRGKVRQPRGQKNTFDPDEQDVELFNTYKLLSEQFDHPDPLTYATDEYYEFPILSTEWLKKLEAHTKGQGPLPTEKINQDLLDEDKLDDQTRVFEWGKKRAHYNHILKKKLRFKKDYVICPEPVWDMLKEIFDHVQIVRKFCIEKQHFVCAPFDLETVRIRFT